MPKRSRDKGKRGEREVVALFKAHGFEARRGQQYRGGPDSPDVIHDVPGLHVEVKFREQASLFVALEQASRDAALEDTPVVFMRKLRKPWLVVIDADDFLDLIEEIQNTRMCIYCHRKKYQDGQETD